MVRASCFLVFIQRPPIHLLRLAMLALISVKGAQVVDGEEGECMVRAPCFLVSIQRPPIHLLRLGRLALISIEAA